MDRPLLGVVLFLASSVLFSASDTAAKFLTGTMPPIEIAWLRYIVFAGLASTPMLRSGPAAVRTRRHGVQVLRGLLVVGSAVFFIASLSSLPLAEAATINFVSPLLVTALSVPMLGERVGLGGWIAVGIGFAGVLIVVQPGTAGLQAGAIPALLAAACWVMATIMTRRMAASERATATLFWTAVSGLVVLTLLLPFVWRAPTLPELLLAVGIGFISSSGQWLTVLAYRYAAASLIAPLAYLQLIFASVFGYIVFGAVPSQSTLIGAVIIAGSGVYAVQAARMQRRRMAEAAVNP
ncbi:MAG: DMT family transporter [Proteobacteria bacterium]|nr:DMT family transporter [Pseudomonadota bacterium]